MIPADFVVVGIGLLPNTELAQAAGLDVDNGIVVNEYAVTSDPDIVAAGDCTSHPSVFCGRRIRLESVPNAVEQARVAAASLAGKPKVYDSVPWFWSDQYDLKLQMTGLSQGYDQFVLRGSMENKSFAAFYLKEGRLIAVDAVNRAQEFMVAKRMVAACKPFDAAALADETGAAEDPRRPGAGRRASSLILAAAGPARVSSGSSCRSASGSAASARPHCSRLPDWPVWQSSGVRALRIPGAVRQEIFQGNRQGARDDRSIFDHRFQAEEIRRTVRCDRW